MAITISGENNNDRILAADGVIDQISGINFSGIITASHINVGSNIQLGNAGIVTATTFVGNLTGNVNSTSPLLLQTGGSERIRLTSNNEIGIAGANYGSAGQVLTSGGSGSAVSWTTISTDLVNDSSPQLGGDLDVNGKKIKFPDLTGSVNNILYFGTHDDLLIYHHADVNYIQCENARTLRFQYWTGSGNETLANFIPNGSVELYFNNAKTLQTTVNALHLFGNAHECNIDLKLANGNRCGFLGFTNSGRVQINGAASGNAYETYLEGNLNGSTKLFYDNTSKIETTTRGIRLQSGLTSGNGISNMLQLDNDGNSNGDGSKITFSRAGMIRTEIEALKNETANNETDIVFRTTNAGSLGEKLRITSNGNVGINRTSPAALLHVSKSYTAPTGGIDGNTCLLLSNSGGSAYAGLAIQGTTSGGSYIHFGDTDDINVGNILYDHPTNSMQLITNATERLRIDSSGRLGLNQTTPASRLHISEAGSNTITIQLTNASTGHTAGTDGMTMGYSTNSSAGFINVCESGSAFTIKTGGTAAGNERLRIDGNGRLIFGHTAALQKFHGPYGTNKRNPQIQINGVNVQQASMSITSWDNNVVGYYGPAIFLAKSGSSTIGTNSRVSNQNSILGSIIFSGDDGDEFVKGAMIQGAVDGGVTTGNNDMPGRLMFFTTADGAQEPTERMRINNNGTFYFSENIATQSPSGQFGFRMDRGGGNATSLNVENLSNDSVNNNAGIKLVTNHSNVRIIHHNQGGFYIIQSASGYLHYYQNGVSRVYIDTNGRVGVNYTGTAGWAEKLNVRGDYGSGEYAIAAHITHSQGSLMRFGTSSGLCGSIYGNGTGCSFNTSSDYRLKENDVNITDGISRVKQLRPIRFNWKSDPSKIEDGFFAHEVSPVVPESVTGEKDAEIDEIGEGYQKIDHSKLVPLLTAALQEAITEIETLKTKVNALEGS